MRHEAKIKNQLCPWNFIQCFRKIDKAKLPSHYPQDPTHTDMCVILALGETTMKKYIYKKNTWRILLSDFLRSICNFLFYFKEIIIEDHKG